MYVECSYPKLYLLFDFLILVAPWFAGTGLVRLLGPVGLYYITHVPSRSRESPSLPLEGIPVPAPCSLDGQW